MRTAQRIEAALGTIPIAGPSHPESTGATTVGGPIPLPDPFDNDISPWLVRRLDLATALATQLRDDAARILQPLNDNTPEAKTTPA
ncbi:hypothetical protein D9M69_588110 [compost metagenome]